jgi:hypothetical protein
MIVALLRCMSPVLAQSGLAETARECLLSGDKRTSLLDMSSSAFDPFQTSASPTLDAKDPFRDAGWSRYDAAAWA